MPAWDSSGEFSLRGGKSKPAVQETTSVHVPPWVRKLPFPVPVEPILGEDLYVCCIGHAFGQIPPEPGIPPRFFVTDFLVDQSQSTGGGARMADPIQFDLTQSSGYSFNILAACGKRFHVNLPSNVTNASFSAYLGRQEINPPSGIFTPLPDQVTFENLVGQSPTITYNNFSITHASNSALFFEIEGQVSSSLQFSGINFSAYFTRTIDAGAKWYNPLSYAVPFGTKDIYPKSETFVIFGYQTDNSKDPGPFVSLA
jgi:hypothetical protein